MPLAPIFAHSSVMNPFPSVPDGFGDYDDFNSCAIATTAMATKYKLDNGTGTGAISAAAVHGGAVRVESGASANDNSAIRDQADHTTPAFGRTILFAARFLVEDADEDAFFIGLAKIAGLTNSNVLAKTFTASGTFEGMGFYADHSAAGTPTLKYAVGTAAAVSAGSTGLTMADGTYMNVGLICTDAKQVEIWAGVEGSVSKIATVVNSSTTTYIPTASPLGKVAQVKTLDTGADYIQLDAWLNTCQRA